MNSHDSSDQLNAFIALVRREGQRLYRDLPWRGIADPWLVLLSEVMLQQTQVSRVLGHWQSWVDTFSTVDSLAAASVGDVLKLWQGLGYNRRALALKRAAEICSVKHKGSVPSNFEDLLALPGVGPASAAGVCVFAFQQPQIYLETNVRTVFIHHFFPSREKVRDSEIVPHIKASCDVVDPRGWYYALLDYGSELKRTLPNPSRRAMSHTRQSVFEGSQRQKRAFVLREILAHGSLGILELLTMLNHAEKTAGRTLITEEELTEILQQLTAEGFLQQSGTAWSIVQ